MDLSLSAPSVIIVLIAFALGYFVKDVYIAKRRGKCILLFQSEFIVPRVTVKAVTISLYITMPPCHYSDHDRLQG